MNLTIEIPEASASRFEQQAKTLGMSIDRWLIQLAEQNTPAQSAADLQMTNPEEWTRQFEDWVNSHRRGLEPLSAADVSRESIYPDRV